MIKTLIKSIREFKRDSLLSPLFMCLEVAMEVLIPFFMATIIDKGIAKSDMVFTVQMGIILALVAMTSLFFGRASGKYAARASAGFARNLRKDMFYNIQNFSFTNIDKFSTSSLITRMTTDVTNVQNAYQMIVRILVRGPIMLICSFVLAFTINSELALIFLLTIPVLGVGLVLIILKAHPYFERVFKKYDRLNLIVQENVSAIRVVKAFVRERKENEKFHEISNEVYNEFRIAEKIVAFNSPLMQFCMYSTILFLSSVGAQRIIVGTMSAGQLQSMIVYAVQILSSLMMLSMVFVMIIIAQSSVERIVEVLDEESSIQNGPNPLLHVADGSIDFNQVDFSYISDDNKLVIKDFNIHIKSGETIGVIGGTGSSKSTFVQLIPRLYDVTRGELKVGGVDVRNYDIDTLRNQVAMVLQKNVLFKGTIKENLRWGNPEASDEELIDACKQAQADDFIRAFPDQYDTMIEQGGNNVSGGQKQRLCIARALLKKPKILILDDSTSAVDTKTDAMIRKAFLKEIPDTTKIIIAQRISSIEDADRIIVLDKGEMNAVGTPAELLANNTIYQEVFNSQMKGSKDDE